MGGSPAEVRQRLPLHSAVHPAVQPMVHSSERQAWEPPNRRIWDAWRHVPAGKPWPTTQTHSKFARVQTRSSARCPAVCLPGQRAATIRRNYTLTFRHRERPSRRAGLDLERGYAIASISTRRQPKQLDIQLSLTCFFFPAFFHLHTRHEQLSGFLRTMSQDNGLWSVRRPREVRSRKAFQSRRSAHFPCRGLSPSQ
jgi:hypothetical protein